MKDFREKVGMTHTELADELNITQATVAIWETGQAMPRADKLPALARILECDVSDLFEKDK